ncbi:MAG: IclR family transcriptional regulator, partial [Phototrophicales bacterium]
VYTLVANHYLDQNPDSKKYSLGLKFIERAAIVFNQLEIRHVAMPYLEHLRNWSNESINLAIRDHNEVVYIERMLSDQPLGIRTEIGKRAWVHCTALGKAILSRMPEDEAREILESYPLEAFTVFTMTDVDQIMDDLRLTRQRGFALDNQENEMGGCCVAAPILNYKGEPIAAISISVPLPRIPADKIGYFGNKVQEVAEQISERLG